MLCFSGEVLGNVLKLVLDIVRNIIRITIEALYSEAQYTYVTLFVSSIINNKHIE